MSDEWWKRKFGGIYTLNPEDYHYLSEMTSGSGSDEDTQVSLYDYWRKNLPSQIKEEIKDTPPETQGCNSWSHEWVNVGFHMDKWVCKKCDKDKPNE